MVSSEKQRGEKKSKRKSSRGDSTPKPVQAAMDIDGPLPDTTIDNKKDRKRKRHLKATKENETSKSGLSLNHLHPPHQSSGTPAITPTNSTDASAFLTKHSITIHTPPSLPPVAPVISFDQLQVPEALKAAFKNFNEPTPIQACAWPPALQGHDVHCSILLPEINQLRNSGKTLAFGIPALFQLVSASLNVVKTKKSKSKSTNSVSVLVVAPTRELALQTHDALSTLGAPFSIASVAVFGGVDKAPQINALKNGDKDGNVTRIVVGTPGRILDLVDAGALRSVEADRMLDRGFENDIRKIISYTMQGADRQTMMFSATWPEAVRRLASTFLRNPVRVTVGSDDLTANSRVEQIIEVFDDPREKDSRLAKTLKMLSHKKTSTKGSPEARILVFALYKKEASRVESTLRQHGYSVGALHGDMSQSARMDALDKFKTGETGLLVATDVAARGLDIPNVGAVINYTFPLTIEDYIHRIGRTGRGGRSGKSITFFTGENHERALAGELARVLRDSRFDEMADKLQKFPMTIKKKTHDHPYTLVILSSPSLMGYTDADYECRDENEGSIVTSLISQLRVGMDLSKVTFPTFVLEPRSMLERITDFMSHPDLIFGAENCTDPEERFIRVLQYYLAGWHIKPKGVKKPYVLVPPHHHARGLTISHRYNPVLGEFFRCRYDYANGTRGFYVAEQGRPPLCITLSHHPPISAYFYISPENRLSIIGELRPKSKFLGNSVSTTMEGENRITLLGKPDDGGTFHLSARDHFLILAPEYVVTMPNMYARGILFGKMVLELGDTCTVRNERRRLSCDLEFKTKGFFSGTYNAIVGRVRKASYDAGEVSGRWSHVMEFKGTPNGTKRVLFDVAKDGQNIAPKYVAPEDEQEPYESRRLWHKLTQAIEAKDMEAATRAKTAVEDAQRDLRRRRDESGEIFVPRYFELRDGRWYPKLNIPQDSSDTAIQTVESWIWSSA
ncbi:hypothetical protein J3R83DRAFT_7084 [Lanmaoa asiatica]|nr:hypothetical protein J3R83DRAFT_7084 [Lanmaoa asiatica]